MLAIDKITVQDYFSVNMLKKGQCAAWIVFARLSRNIMTYFHAYAGRFSDQYEELAREFAERLGGHSVYDLQWIHRNTSPAWVLFRNMKMIYHNYYIRRTLTWWEIKRNTRIGGSYMAPESAPQVVRDFFAAAERESAVIERAVVSQKDDERLYDLRKRFTIDSRLVEHVMSAVVVYVFNSEIAKRRPGQSCLEEVL